MLDRPVPQPEFARPNPVRALVWVLAGALLTIGAGIVAYLLYVEDRKYDPIYARLGTAPIPKIIANIPMVSEKLARLSANPCSNIETSALADALADAGRKDLASSVRRGHSRHCLVAVPGNATPADLLATVIETTSSADTRRLARQVQDNLCNPQALLALVTRLSQGQNSRAAAGLGDAFLANCGADNGIAYQTTMAYYEAGDAAKALQMARANERLTPNTALWPAWIGRSLMKLGRYSEAADAFQRSLTLWSNPSNVVYAEFWNASNALKMAGRYCDAMKPLVQYVSYAPVERSTPQVQKELETLAGLGKCP